MKREVRSENGRGRIAKRQAAGGRDQLNGPHSGPYGFLRMCHIEMVRQGGRYGTGSF